MEQNKMEKVSIIVPCFNVAQYLSTFFQSLLQQTYDNIELILVNDGSTDNTEEIIKGNMDILRCRLEVKYINQKNKGLGGAINTGLKCFTGEYLCWADPDDYLEASSIEKRVRYLKENLEVAVVTSDAEIRNESVEGEIMGYMSQLFAQDNEKKDQFMLLLKAKSILCSGCHMIRREAFLDVNPERDIYEARRGQNWQLLLPVYYKYKRGFLKEPLYRYIIYPSSMSQGDDTAEKKIIRELEHREIVFNTLDRMNIVESEKKYYKKIFNNLTQNDLFNIAIQNEELEKSLKYFWNLLGTEYITRDKIVDILVLIRKKMRK